MTRCRVAVFCPWVPTATLSHAGGRQVRSHLEELSGRHDLRVVAPGGQSCDEAAWAVDVVPADSSRSAIARSKHYLQWLRQGVGPGPVALRRLGRWLHGPAGQELLDWADLVEVQYEEMLPVLDYRWPSKPVVLWCHDVVSAELSAQMRLSTSFRLRLEAASRLPAVRRLERSAFPRVSGVVTFNPEDVPDLRQRGVTAAIRVLRPAISEPATVPELTGTASAVTVAAWNRPVNAEGLRWLTRSVWPRVVDALPQAKLLVVGEGAPSSPNGSGVQCLGFVSDLSGVYSDSSLAIVPATGGVGLKFTVAQALAHGRPVITRTSSARGYGEAIAVGAVVVEDDSVAFAEAIVRLLSDQSQLQRLGKLGRRWWSDYSSRHADDQEIATWYEELVSDARS